MAAPPFIQNFIDGPKGPKIAVGVIGLIAINALLAWFLILPAQQEIQTLEGRKSQLQADLTKNRAAAAQIDRYRAEIAELEKKLVVLREKLPTEKETPSLYKSLSDAAHQANLGVSLFQPGALRPRDVVSEVPVTVTAEGGYHDLGRFFARVASLPRVVNVTGLKLTGLAAQPGKPASRHPLRAELTLSTYVYRTGPAGPAPPRPAAPAPRPGTVPPGPAGARS